MKIILSLVIAFSAFSASAADIGIATSGLRCTMEYSNGSALSSFRDSNTEWMVAGNDMVGSAVVNDGDGIAGTSPANYLTVDKASSKGQTMWILTVQNSEKTTIGILLFPEGSGIKGTFEVNAVYNDSEDPPSFNVLEVTCESTSFAG